MKTKITLLLCLISYFAIGQRTISSFNANELFDSNKEIYFLLKGAATEANKLTNIISIDNVKNGDIYAYASLNQFNNLKEKYDFPLVQLPKPSEVVKVEMSDSPREVLDWNYYPTYNAYLQIMQDFATNYPEICNIDTIGLTNDNRLIIVARISDNVGLEEDEPEFLYTSSMHGDEIAGYVITLHLIDYLLTNYGIDARITDMINSMDIWINPLANPDGTYAGGNNSVNGATRYNAYGVDLNRNYPDPSDGPHPDGNNWQTETIAFMDFAEGRDFVMSANFHGGAEVINYPWDTWSRVTADDNWWYMVSRQYADTVHVNSIPGYLTDLNNGITNGYAWYRITGGRQDYMNYFHQCREVTIEISENKMLPANQLLNYWNYNYRSLLNYMEESLYGVRGIITDTITGEPLIAQIFISGHDQDSSMVFSSLPVGNYHRLIKGGTYNITFIADGYIPRTIKNVVVTDKSTVVLNLKLWDGTPIPAFTVSDTLIAPGNPVQFFDISGGSPYSRLWTFEGGTPSTSTEANPVVTYEEEGQYNVTLTVNNLIGSNTIMKEDYITVEEGVGVKRTDLFETYIYPNPASGSLLTIKSSLVISSYTISDLSGRKLWTENVNNTETFIDITNLRKGIYNMTVYTHKGITTHKLIRN